MSELLTVTPNPAQTAQVVSVTGTGFHKRKTKLYLDGVAGTTNTFLPGRDGSFTVGIVVSATPKTQTLVAKQLGVPVASTSIVVQTSVVPVVPANVVAVPGDTVVTLSWT